jgi:serine protease Do
MIPKEMRDRLDDMDPENVPEQLGFGSGAIIDKTGVILTNNHVVENAKTVKVITHDGQEFESSDIVRDPKTDVAIVRLKPEDVSQLELPVAKLGDSDNVEIGDWVLAMGSPFGLTGTVTSGIISAKGRAPRELNLLYKDFIQTDAAINPGNSGGPLVDLDGNIVGVNTAIRSSTGSFGGIGFAIPSNMVNRVVKQLLEHGRVKRSYLGIAMRPLSKRELVEKNIKAGIEVTGLAQGPTPARKAGLKPSDIILSVNGKDVGETMQLQNLVTETTAGETVTMKVQRGESTIDVPVVLEEQPDQFGIATTFAAGNVETPFGITLLERNKELIVSEVEADGKAAEAGIQVGDIILQVERQNVSTLDEFRSSAAAAGADGVMVKLRSEDGKEKLVVISAE